MKAKLFAAAILGATLALSACGESPEQPAAQQTTGIPGMKISNARMVLAPVPGNPAAIYFDLAYDGDQALALNRAEVKGAKSAMFHDYGEYDFKVQMMEMLPVPLKKGDKLEFKPGGKHLMAMDVSPDLKPGGTTEATVIVSGGARQTFPVEIRAAGDER
ncbi:copper chaperone PCu(A)C [Tsuneonella rigui]|jgi:copper(I)-binding protein|uniref:copper chaperone PCu(A)C n=1 Tax=Tsuneonella rigui TaxID=1708790 RepID=UPI000F7EA657|nr:copper chaperone PCu(A)C [Tsuneonella rigui]